ncbi:MAG: OmpA family protein [Polyangiaceae bacterium]|nr:OmpA family protein [Polyangiaceae bacterium]
MKLVRSSALVACLLACAGSASAQERGGFSLNRFNPSERGSEWFSEDTLDLRGHMRFALGAVGDYSHKPLVLYDAGGDEVSAIVEHQLFVHLGGALILWDRLRLGLSVPVVAWNEGDTGVLNGAFIDGKEGGGVGDLRLAADARLLGEYRSAFSLAFGVQAHLPTGDREAFTSDGKVRITPRLAAAGEVGGFAYAARAGFNYRAQSDDFAGDPFGSEMLFGAAAGLRVADGKLLLGPEVYGSTVVSDGGDGMFKRRTTPLEVLIGGHYTAGDVRFGLGAGPGLTRGAGAPQFRVLASLEYFPAVKTEEAPGAPSDRDGDGILDADDACPDVPGVASEDPKKHGCPAPTDRDGDGIFDADDACPDEAGVASEDPKKHGCPLPPDRDGDGIFDAADACPDEAGVASDDPSKHGCPLPKDRDGDGILDADDACPDLAGPADPDPKKHGCPKAKVVGTKIEILERVEFDTNKATIRPESDGVLTAVLDVLKKYPQIKKVRVEGHTDNRGGAAHNLGLSKRRAAAVMKWLIDRGIDKGRLVSDGLGQTKPIDTNDTADGRQNNRRVEFNILETEGSLEVETK